MRRSHTIILLLAAGLAGAIGLAGAALAAPVPPAPPRWPSLAEQLDAAGVGGPAADSALARLIAENQDFRLLRPEESGDGLPLPPWLRVWWRRAHPEGPYPAGDPTGGYPLVLKEIHEWMLTHPDLQPGEGEPAVAPGEDAERSAAVSAEQRISDPAGRRSESDIRVNYRDPSKIVAASNNISSSGYQVQYWSADGGLTWGRTTLPPVFEGGSADSFQSDPAVDWTSDGTAWAATLGIRGGGGILKLRVYKSADGGATWTFDSTVSGAQTSADKEMMWVDHSAASPFKDSIYLVWHNGAPVYLSRRTPGAGTWSAPVLVSGAETTGTGIGSDVKTNAQGDVFAFWPDTGSRFLYRSKSTDGGASFSAPLSIGRSFGAYDIAVPAFASRRALIYVSGGAYRTATKDLVYAVWNDLAGGPDCDQPGEAPGSNVASPCKTRIWFTRSTDGGATWAAARKINDQASLNDQFNPWMVVDETTGALGVIYYDTVADPGRKKTDLWYQSSFNDGGTWTPPVKVTSAPTDETTGSADFGNQYGDYNGLSGIAGRFFPSWTDRRGGGNEEIWTAAVQDLACTFPGAPAIVSTGVPGGQQNTLEIAWADGAPPGDRYNIYRALGSCAAPPESFAKVGSAVSGFAYTDAPLSGGLTYSYRVTALDPTGFCESQPSGCASATPTGPCLEPPSFAGLASAASAGDPTCGVALAWAAATPLCSGPVTYDVYRSPAPGFTPGPANRIATGVAGTAYLDASPLVAGGTYYYLVRTVDASNGAADGNAVERSAAPLGLLVTTTLSDTFEGGQSGGGFDLAGWSHAAVAGGVDWAWSAAQSESLAHSWFSACQGIPAERVLVSPSFVAQAGSTLSFRHTFDMELNPFYCVPGDCCDGGTLEVTTDGGVHWTTVPDAAFTAGGFNGTVYSSENPLAGKRAWCGGALGAMTAVGVDLSGWAGSEVRLRWRAGEDFLIARPGWYVDSVTLANVKSRAACASAATPAADFFTLPPCRLVDTRAPGQGPALAPLAERQFTLAGACGVPAGAKALSVNVTVTQPAAPGHLALYPANHPAPGTSVINFTAGATRANNAILALDAAGAVKVRSGANGTVHLVIDVNGYFE
jgi:hypothetical protein